MGKNSQHKNKTQNTKFENHIQTSSPITMCGTIQSKFSMMKSPRPGMAGKAPRPICSSRFERPPPTPQPAQKIDQEYWLNLLRQEGKLAPDSDAWTNEKSLAEIEEFFLHEDLKQLDSTTNVLLAVLKWRTLLYSRKHQHVTWADENDRDMFD